MLSTAYHSGLYKDCGTVTNMTRKMKSALISLHYLNISFNCRRLLIDYRGAGCWSITKLSRQGLALNALCGYIPKFS